MITCNPMCLNRDDCFSVLITLRHHILRIQADEWTGDLAANEERSVEQAAEKKDAMNIRSVISSTFRVRESSICPQCGRTMYRVRRKLKDRILSIFFPVVRRECCGRSHLVAHSVKGHPQLR